MVEIIKGDCLEVLKTMGDNSVDLILTDPPYELGFMGKKWDKSGIAFNQDLWKEALRVLKSGGYLMAFSGTRTYHNMAYAIEQAGFNMKDMIAYTYGSGFPKALDVSKAIDKKLGKEREVVGISNSGMSDTAMKTDKGWNDNKMGKEIKITTPASDLAKLYEGYKTALKPAIEPIVIAQKPLEGTYVDNVMKYGTGGLNIDDCRIGTTENLGRVNKMDKGMFSVGNGASNYANVPIEEQGRYPANFIISEDIAPILDEQSGISKSTIPNKTVEEFKGNIPFDMGLKQLQRTGFNDKGGASRFFYNTKLDEEDYIPFFYTSKASKKERNSDVNGNLISGEEKGAEYYLNSKLRIDGTEIKPIQNINNHPTLKPISIMKYLATLGLPPADSVVLDMFGGSGTTGLAIEKINQEKGTNHKCILIEREPEYVEIIKKRLGVEG